MSTSAEVPTQAKQDPAVEAVAVQAADPQVPLYSNSVIKVTAEAGVAVMVVRDGLNGDERFQYPAEKVVEEYKSHADEAVAKADSGQPEVAADKPVDAKASPPPAETQQPAPVAAPGKHALEVVA